MVSLKVGCVERFFQMFFQNFSLFPYISIFTAHFVAYLSSLLELPRRGRTKVGKTLVPLFPPFCSSLGKGYDSLTPDQNLANFSPIPIFIICTWNYFASIGKTLSLKCFQIAPANIKSMTSKQAVYILLFKLATWPIRACTYLNYFITIIS